MQLCGFQDYRSAVSTLTYTPRLEDNNALLTCVGTMSASRPKQVSNVKLRVSCEYVVNICTSKLTSDRRAAQCLILGIADGALAQGLEP